MGDAEDLKLLRDAYERALADYEAACSVLNRRLLNLKRASPQELQRERIARAALDAARGAYLEAWKRKRDSS